MEICIDRLFGEYLSNVTTPITVSRCAFCFFFFQAEDGIRDYKVTGVQTCALPICYGRPVSLALLLCYPFSRHIAASRRPLVVADARRHPLTARTPAVRDGLVTARSEERRVGKEGRSRWSPDH